MDYNNLNHDEVTELINKLKYPKKIKSFEECFATVSALFGKVNIDEPVIDRENEIEYVLHAYRAYFLLVLENQIMIKTLI